MVRQQALRRAAAFAADNIYEADNRIYASRIRWTRPNSTWKER